jgi:signal transduction histidine kinase
MVSLMAATAAFGPFGTSGGFVLIPGEVAAALFLGLWVASRANALRAREEQARHAVDAERLRIARELHDVVAHTMATINVQASVAAHVIERQPDQAAQALDVIKQAARKASESCAASSTSCVKPTSSTRARPHHAWRSLMRSSRTRRAPVCRPR